MQNQSFIIQNERARGVLRAGRDSVLQWPKYAIVRDLNPAGVTMTLQINHFLAHKQRKTIQKTPKTA